MSSVAEASTLLHRVAGPADGRKIKRLIEFAAKRAKLSYTRAKDIWYGDARRIDAAEMDRIREAAAKRDIEVMRERLLAMRESLAATDPEFHRETIDALERALCGMGCAVVPLGLRQERRSDQHHVKQYRSA